MLSLILHIMVFLTPLLAGIGVGAAFGIPSLGLNDQLGIAIAGTIGALLSIPLSYIGAKQIKARFK